MRSNDGVIRKSNTSIVLGGIYKLKDEEEYYLMAVSGGDCLLLVNLASGEAYLDENFSVKMMTVILNEKFILLENKDIELIIHEES